MNEPATQIETSSPLPTGPLPVGPAGRGSRGVFLLLALGFVATGAVLIADVVTENDTRQPMTHRIARGDLAVSVVEQGTLESSNNTEIKCKVRGFSTVTSIVKGGTFVQPGDLLFTLDTKIIEESVSLTETNTHIATATLARSQANVRRSEIAIEAYLNGRYREQRQRLQQELEIAEANLLTAKKLLNQTKLLFKRGYVNKLEVEGNEFTVQQAELDLKVANTRIKVLEDYTKKMQMATMEGNLTASRSKEEADIAGLDMEKKRRDRAKAELASCVTRAERAGLVIYPSAAAWKNAPDVEEGATVRKDQVLLLMPDLTKMQVKVGVHESVIDRVRPGLKAIVTLPDRKLEAEVTTVATVTRPAGWWTGNIVKYDTIIRLPSDQGLKPGMSAQVEIILETHKNVLTVPVAAVVETDHGDFCWVRTARGPEQRKLKLGDSNEVFLIVESGLKEDDDVILNPTAYLDEAQKAALRSSDSASARAKASGPEKRYSSDQEKAGNG